jgi:serine/threonine protein kinase
MSLQSLLVDDYDIPVNEAVAIEDFLLPMLEYDPKKRISAREALKHPWLWTR